MRHCPWLVGMVAVLALACGGGERARTDVAASRRRIGSTPSDTLMAALDDYGAKRISADSAAAVIMGYQQRTGRSVNIEMDGALLAAVQRRSQR